MNARWMLLVLMLSPAVARADEAEAQPAAPSSIDIEFFEKSVRPLLVSACGDCHGEKKQWGGLRVDSRTALLKGGDSGPALKPGKPDESLLIAAVRRTGDVEMPPEKPLTAEQVAVLERWVKLGAPWPAEDVVADRQARQRSHWAFQPISRPTPPNVAPSGWLRTPVDAFVLAKLHEAKLTPAPPADRRTLIRRATYTLTGLPPTAEEVDAFVNDPDPQAYAKLIDRLLESPRYGEHWARHWLDLARYADTKGYMFGWEPGRFLHSNVYRDWVVAAFQRDLPYDEFLLKQIAADQASPNDPTAQAAMGFLTVGRRFLGNEHDVIDDRIDVVGRTTMGLTFGCARCHDHKYDPIPIEDYYSLYGVFGNSAEQIVQATPSSPENPTAFEQELHKRVAAFQAEFQRYRALIANRARDRVADYLVALLSVELYPNIPFSQILAEDDIFPAYVQRWDAYLRKAYETNDPVFVPWRLFAALPKEDFAGRAPEVIAAIKALPPGEVSPLVAAQFETAPASMREVADRYGALLLKVHRDWKSLVEQAEKAGQPLPTQFDDPNQEALRQVLYGPHSPCLVPDESLIGIGDYFSTRGELEQIWKLQRAVEEWIHDGPAAPAFAVRMVDKKLIEEPRVFRRGSPGAKANEVPRRFPQVVAGADSPPFATGSGRLELAQGIIAPTNPLTARVWVNRLWQYHFGAGLVPTSSDFGVRAATPEHLDLLDWLATKLIEEKWSTKAIHRQILLSATYQQQATGPEDADVRKLAQERDPENRLYWKMNTHRLTFEEWRDSMLQASGSLDLTAGGRGSALFAGDSNHRRTLYGFIDRQMLPDVYRVFDFANPDLHIPVRSETTVSQQALFALNHPFIAARATELAGQLEKQADVAAPQRIQELYRRLYQRPPTARQLDQAMQFLAGAETVEAPQYSPEQLAWTYGYGSIQDDAKELQNFRPLPHFTGSAWQGGDRWPDPALGWSQLTADGGHPGNDHDHAVVRRWTAAHAGEVTIDSLATHQPTAGNGIRCWVFSSRHGVLKQFTLHHDSKKVEIPALAVEAGDTIDFVVDVNGNLGFDEHLWPISIQEKAPAAPSSQETATVRNWDSRRDFAGPKTNLLTPWQQLVQVLLLSNEFLFVD